MTMDTNLTAAAHTSPPGLIESIAILMPTMPNYTARQPRHNLPMLTNYMMVHQLVVERATF